MDEQEEYFERLARSRGVSVEQIKRDPVLNPPKPSSAVTYDPPRMPEDVARQLERVKAAYSHYDFHKHNLRYFDWLPVLFASTIPVVVILFFSLPSATSTAFYRSLLYAVMALVVVALMRFGFLPWYRKLATAPHFRCPYCRTATWPADAAWGCTFCMHEHKDPNQKVQYIFNYTTGISSGADLRIKPGGNTFWMDCENKQSCGIPSVALQCPGCGDPIIFDEETFEENDRPMSWLLDRGTPRPRHRKTLVPGLRMKDRPQ